MAVYDTLSHLVFSLCKLVHMRIRSDTVLFFFEHERFGRRWCINQPVKKRKINLRYRLVKLHSKRAEESLRDQHLNQNYYF